MMPERVSPVVVPQRFRKFLVTDDFDRHGLVPGQPTPTPQYLQVELTDLCNLACAGCLRAVHESSGRHLSLKAFVALLDQLPSLGHVSFVGGGEALIVRDFAAYVQACTDRSVFTSTNTNGLLVRRRLEPVLDAGLGLIAISVDGADDVALGRMRSGLRLSQLSTALREAVALTKGRETGLSAAVTLSSTNLEQFPAIVEFVADHGLTRISVESLHHWGEDKTLNAESLFARPVQDVVPQLEAGLARADERGLQLSIFDYSRLASPAAAQAVCPWPWDASYITKDGDVTPCCVHMESSPGNVLGNIHQAPMAEIWVSKPYGSLRDSFLQGPAWSSCEGCVYRMEFGRV
ncbi:radical SAM/SPASM domain-containing protein [Kitasatospora sp. NPDC050543]|uniref:radical SAM/SPASM domain-containing protein n=1 Tax=Kitasatospora sp. NPDC050543 TaxID=3364054 RepID=UPI0037B90951